MSKHPPPSGLHISRRETWGNVYGAHYSSSDDDAKADDGNGDDNAENDNGDDGDDANDNGDDVNDKEDGDDEDDDDKDVGRGENDGQTTLRFSPAQFATLSRLIFYTGGGTNRTMTSTSRRRLPCIVAIVVVAIVIRADRVPSVGGGTVVAAWISTTTTTTTTTTPGSWSRSSRPPTRDRDDDDDDGRAMPYVVGGRPTLRASYPPPRCARRRRRRSSSSLRLWNWGNGDVRDGGGGVEGDCDDRRRVPFVIQNIGRGKRDEIEEIVRLCIDVFFNDDKRGDDRGSGRTMTTNMNTMTTPWKEMQLAYLRNFQTGDILARNAFRKDQLVDLIVARRVYPVIDGTDASTTTNGRIVGDGGDVIDDVGRICNADALPIASSASGTTFYRTGEIIGYCEVSEKNFGLGDNYDNDNGSRSRSHSRSRRTKDGNGSMRPYLSNLSVVECARGSGIGSELLDACVQAVRDWNANHTEIVLQVEEDNPNAIQFYKRRGWEFVFADPTCRRYDTSGIFLRETRVTKYAMVKRLDDDDGGGTRDENEKATDVVGSQFLRRLRSSFFVQ